MQLLHSGESFTTHIGTGMGDDLITCRGKFVINQFSVLLKCFTTGGIITYIGFLNVVYKFHVTWQLFLIRHSFLTQGTSGIGDLVLL